MTTLRNDVTKLRMTRKQMKNQTACRITREALDEGKIQHTGWTLDGRDTRLLPGPLVQQCGVNVLDYFDSSGKFLGPDANKLAPTFDAN